MNNADAIKCAVLAHEIYADFSTIRFGDFTGKKPELFENLGTDTQCAILPGDSVDAIYIVFRGTEKNADWKINVDFSRKLFEVRLIDLPPVSPIPGPEGSSGRQIVPVTDLASDAPRAKMHEGFVSAYMSVQDQIHRFIRAHDLKKITITGHSLGGALATLCAIDIQLTYQGAYALEIFTFGSPKVGNPEFCDLFNKHIPRSHRFINGLDIVPSFPRPWQGYTHVETEYRLGSRFSWQFLSRRVIDHGITEYVAALRK